MSPAFDPYKNRKVELSIDQGCFNEAQPRISRMKSLARSCLLWVKMNEDIEKRVKTCESCQKHQLMSASAQVHPWERTNNPWVRLYIDYLGPFMG